MSRHIIPLCSRQLPDKEGRRGGCKNAENSGSGSAMCSSD